MPHGVAHLSYCAEAFGGRALIINHDFKDAYNKWQHLKKLTFLRSIRATCCRPALFG